MNAHFFDINSLITSNGQVWLVSKTKPNFPIVKILPSDFNLIKAGVFKKFEEKINVSGVDYWLPKDLADKIKIRCSKEKVDPTTLSFSMQEFMNPELIKDIDYKIWNDNFIDLRNSNDDVYIICSKNTKKNYEFLIQKLEEKLYDLGLKVKNFYFISETFYNRNEDEISHKKVRLLLQHLIGLKTEGDKFTDEEITKYQTVYFYDDEKNVIDFANNCNSLLKLLHANSSDDLKAKVKSIISDEKPQLVTNLITFNKVNKFVTKKTDLTIDNIFKKFESFNLFYPYSTLRS